MLRNPLAGRGDFYSPLLWLAQRLGKNRERLGVHYPSDTFGSRHLAGAIWRAVLHDGRPRNARLPGSTPSEACAAKWPPYG